MAHHRLEGSMICEVVHSKQDLNLFLIWQLRQDNGTAGGHFIEQPGEADLRKRGIEFSMLRRSVDREFYRECNRRYWRGESNNNI